MIKFLDKLHEYALNNPNHIAFIDEVTREYLTYADLDLQSARVYNYLKQNNITKEDFVLIKLRRSFMPIIVAYGVLKAGAAFVLVEEDYSPERIEFIKNDSKAKLIVDVSNIDEILKTDPLKAREKVDLKQACYAVYTSGSTGTPKGVLHEYGNLDEIIASAVYDGKAFVDQDEVYPIMAPLNMMAGIIGIILTVGYNITGHIISYATLKNPKKLIAYFEENGITIAFFPPSMVRGIITKFNSQLRKLVLSSEPASGIYFDNLKTYNFYCSSETGCIAASFLIDKLYDNVPIGKNHFKQKTAVINDHGDTVNKGEEGELIIECAYTRGYINLEDKNKQTFVDGYLHTGDIVVENEDNNYIVKGRKDDMIKINGNRIEPAEIETAVKNILNLTSCVAKGVKTGDKNYICVYYVDEIEFDQNDLRQKLLNHLPYYMIPSYYIHLKEYPKAESGKINKKALPLPDISISSEYIAPKTELEKKLCDAYAKVLKLEKVSADADFFLIGGDSLSTIELILELNIPELSFNEIYKYRTPIEIAKVCFDTSDNIDEENAKCLKKAFPITPYQTYMFDYQLSDALSTMNILPVLLKFKKDTIDPYALKEGFNVALYYHPIFGTKFSVNENCEIVQSYNENDIKLIDIINTTDEEFEKIKFEYLKPYYLLNNVMVNYGIYVTETTVYLLMTMSHIISDGTSVTNFFKDVFKCMNGITPDTDYYYYHLSKISNINYAKEASEYYKELFAGRIFECMPKYDYQHSKGVKQGTTRQLFFKDLKLTKSIDELPISINEALTMSELLAIKEYNQCENVMVNWTYNGRNSTYTKNIVSLLISNLPVCISFNSDITYRELLTEMKKQMVVDMRYCYLSYGTQDNSPMKNDRLTIYYQHNIGKTGSLPIECENLDLFTYLNGTVNAFNIIVNELEEGLLFIYSVNDAFYTNESLNKFADLFVETFKKIIEHADNDFDAIV